MCGIFGLHSPHSPVSPETIRAATECISYRGTDDEGTYISADKTTGLGHRRLSILDLSPAGHQPMPDDEGKIHIVFNGEIYNFQELREELESGGSVFRSNSDTEVIIYAYKKWGAECVRFLNGMFAFGILDERGGKKKFFLARDRLGKKPLFYSNYKGRFIFASELKQILVAGVPTDIHEEAVNFYFSLGYIPGEMCMVRDVKKLRPGHYLVYEAEKGSLTVEQFWDLPEFHFPKSEEEFLADIEELIGDAVRRRLVSDVPLGAFLSGGIDSSLVAAFMSRIHGGGIKTFSVGFEGSTRNELNYASLVAKHLGTIHTQIVVKPDLSNDLEFVSGLLDEPIYDNSILPTYYLSKYTRKHVTVALSGDGGDEIFGGYIHYKSALLARKLGDLAPQSIKSLAGWASSFIPEGRFGKNTLYGISYGDNACFVYPSLIFKNDEKGSFFTADFGRMIDAGEPARYRESFMSRNYDFLNRMCYADIKTELADDILVKVDRASMFNSLEVRCPLLDYRIAEYAFRHIPAQFKIRNGIKKYILKKIARKYLPRELELERKQGFDIPGDFLMTTYLADRLLEFPKNEYIERSYIKKLIEDQQSRKIYLWHKLFVIYFFLRWLETWRG